MAQVSGIEVRFSGDTSNLEKSVGRAQGAISKFAKGAAASLAAGLSVGVFVAAGKAAINFADNIGKMAQKVGMTTEELSKLNYAAKLSDVSLSELQVGVQQLSKNMEAGSDGLAALGISATDSAGNLRSTNEVMLEVAEAFAGMEDGAGKTAIAMNIFGRSGAQLIPLLNTGRKGLADMGDEARKLGVVISEEAARKAEQFNDNLTRLSEVMSGLMQSVLAPLLPKLIDLSEVLLDLIKNSNLTSKAVNAMEWVLRNIAKTAATTYKEFYAVSRIALVLTENLANPTNLQGAVDRWKTAFADIRTQAGETEKTLARLSGAFSATPDDVNSMLKSIDEFEQGSGKTKPPRLPGSGDGKGDTERSVVPGVAPSQEVGMFFIDRLEAIRDGFKSERELLEQEYTLNQSVLDNALMNKQMTEEEYRRLTENLEREHQDNLAAIRQQAMDVQLNATASLFGSLARLMDGGNKKMMKLSKAFSAAQVVINTAQGISKAFAQFGWPAGIAPAAAVAASGAAQLASIASAESGKIKGVRGGGGSSRGAETASGGAGGGGPTTTFQFTLMNDPMGFGEKFARQFIDQLNSTQRNGGQIRGVIA
jgi:hypothetical protein